ncbi:RE2 [Symbiodinium sp. CCMP2592]|nr:RE2 [Symbiodinium sp. CCMP2592]
MSGSSHHFGADDRDFRSSGVCPLVSRPELSCAAVLGLVRASGLRSLKSHRAQTLQGEAALLQTFGHFCSPYSTGLTKVTRQRPELVKVLCRAMSEAHPNATFSAVSVLGNGQQRCHHDLVNEKGTLNYLLPLSRFKGGGLWIEDEGAVEEDAVYRPVPTPRGRELRKGKVVPVQPALAFDARRFHEVQEFQGERWMLVGYTPRRLSSLSAEDRSVLESLAFQLPPGSGEPVVPPSIRALFFDQRMPPELCLPASAYECKREVAALVRSIDHQVCHLESALDRANEDPPEVHPLLPGSVEKELAYFYAEDEVPSGPTEDPGAPLQTRTVTLLEVLSELELWLPSWKEEYNSLVLQRKAVRPLTQRDLDQWQREGCKYQLIPSKLVHTLKAHTGHRKARCVCCGNMESHSIYHKHECYAGGADATTPRALLRIASAYGWAVSSFDLRTAFLQSRLLTANRVPTVVKVPWLWRKHGVCVEEFWLVEGALYGLCISCVAWYIDDALILAVPEYSSKVTQFVSGLWSTTPPEYLVPGQVLVYNGFEIEQDGPYLRLHQSSFAAELLSRYPGTECSDVPALPRTTPLQEEARDPALTRQCQALCGEMLWLAIRTRPDLSFAVSMMAQCMAARPAEAWERGLQMRKHPGVAIGYGPPSKSLAIASAMSDASFAPDASRSHQCALTFLGGSLITWSSGRQSFITQSTCEAELVALVQGLQDLESQLPLFRELLLGAPLECLLLCDNKAAVNICQDPDDQAALPVALPDASPEIAPPVPYVFRYTDDLVLMISRYDGSAVPSLLQVLIGAGQAETASELFWLLEFGKFGRMQFLSASYYIVVARTIRHEERDSLGTNPLPFLGNNSNHWRNLHPLPPAVPEDFRRAETSLGTQVPNDFRGRPTSVQDASFNRFDNNQDVHNNPVPDPDVTSQSSESLDEESRAAEAGELAEPAKGESENSNTLLALVDPKSAPQPGVAELAFNTKGWVHSDVLCVWENQQKLMLVPDRQNQICVPAGNKEFSFTFNESRKTIGSTIPATMHMTKPKERKEFPLNTGEHLLEPFLMVYNDPGS